MLKCEIIYICISKIWLNESLGILEKRLCHLVLVVYLFLSVLLIKLGLTHPVCLTPPT